MIKWSDHNKKTVKIIEVKIIVVTIEVKLVVVAVVEVITFVVSYSCRSNWVSTILEIKKD